MIVVTAKSEGQLKRLIVQALPRIEFPCTATFKSGVPRNQQQNNLQHAWITQAAEQLKDESAEDKRAYCKLHFGVPILRNAEPDFRDEYDRIVRPLDYETKLALMRVPLDMPVTRLMTVKQMKQYLDAMYAHFTGQGVQLISSMDGYHGW